MENHNIPRITRRKGACMNCKQRKIRCDGNTTCSQCLKSDHVCLYAKSRSSTVSSRQSYLHARTYHPNTPGHEGKTRGPHVQDQLEKQNMLFCNESQKESTELPYLPSAEFNMSSFNLSERDLMPHNSLPSSDVTDKYDDLSNLITTRCNFCHSKSDHFLSYGADLGWSQAWAETMCRDFSSLAPLRFLSKHVPDNNSKDGISIFFERLTARIRHDPKREASPKIYETTNSLSLYAPNDTTQFLDAFFLDHYIQPPYIDREFVEDTLADLIFSPKSVNPHAFVLVNGVLAIGCRALSLSSSKKMQSSSGSMAQATGYFDRALHTKNEQIGDQPTFLQLQALLTLVIYTKNQQDISLIRTLLSQSIQVIQELTLILPQQPSNPEEIKQQKNMECMFWSLYSIEMPLVIRFGGYSMINDNLIMYDAPSKTDNAIAYQPSAQSRWQLVNYRYARLCSNIVTVIYSKSALKMTPAETATSISDLSKVLEAWRLSIPVAYRPPDGNDLSPVDKTSRESDIQLDLFFKYAEANFAIHRWAMIQGTPSGPADILETYLHSWERCISLSKATIDLTHSFRTDDPELNWPHIHLPLLSASLIFIAVSHLAFGEDQLPYRRYLGMASGYFARLATKGGILPEIFEGVSHLTRISHWELKPSNDTRLQAQDKVKKSQVEKLLWQTASPGMASSTDLLESQLPPFSATQGFDFPEDSSTNHFEYLSVLHEYPLDQAFATEMG